MNAVADTQILYYEYKAQNDARACIEYKPKSGRWMLWVDGGIIGGKYGVPAYPRNGMFDSFDEAYAQMQGADLRFEFVECY